MKELLLSKVTILMLAHVMSKSGSYTFNSGEMPSPIDLHGKCFIVNIIFDKQVEIFNYGKNTKKNRCKLVFNQEHPSLIQFSVVFQQETVNSLALEIVPPT